MTSHPRRENPCRSAVVRSRGPGIWALRLAAVALAGSLLGAAPSVARAQYQVTDTASIEAAARLSSAFRQAVQRVEPSVVTINVSYQGDPPGTASVDVVGTDDRPRIGAGLIIHAQGYIVTSARLLQNASAARIRMADGRVYNAVAGTMATDAASDLAVVKIDATTRLPYATFGSSRTLQRGDWALAVGGGIGSAVPFTAGVIGTPAGAGPAMGRAYAIQHDAKTDWSYAGGPLVNVAGEVVGFNLAPSLKPRGSVASFAYPVDDARSILSSLLQSAMTGGGGNVPTPAPGAYLGLRVTELRPADVARLGATGVQGALVESVVQDGPAWALTMQKDDILLSIDGRAIFTPRDLQAELERRRPGDKVLIHIWRDGIRMGGETTLIDAANRPQ